MKKAIAKKLGRYTAFTEFEEEYIEKWVIDYGYSLDVINLALKRKLHQKQTQRLIILISY